MSILDIFKKARGEHKAAFNGVTFMAPKPISNGEYQHKRNKEIDYLERKYDLSTVAGINAIPQSHGKEPTSGRGASVTGRIEYYLMLKAGGYEKAGEVELALACFRKANELMSVSPVMYEWKSYMRLPRYLRKLRRFDEARAEEAKVSAIFPNGGVFSLTKAEFMDNMIMFGHSRPKANELYKEYLAERDEERKKEEYHSDYDWLWEFIPELCPKSFSGYMRMKNAKTEKYQKLIIAAKEHGRIIK